MRELKFFTKDLNIKNKRVIVRLDLNVPLKGTIIQDKTRIKVIQPLINHLIKSKAKIIVISHLGRPKGKVIQKMSLEPVFKYFSEIFNTKIYFYKDKINNEIIEKTKKINSGEIFFLENIRFHKEEETDDESFAKTLSMCGELFINEAFSCSHRKQASLHNITKFIDSYGGPYLKKELDSINMILENKKRPVVCIIGGAKVSTKINILKKLVKLADELIIVGAMANNFLLYHGYNVGSSLVEKDVKEIIDDIYKDAKESNCKLTLPVDCNISDSYNGKSYYKVLKEINSDDIILDIGKNTLNKIFKKIDYAKTVFWNGPAGYFENKNFEEGTKLIAKKIVEKTNSKSLISVVGGGDTISALKNMPIIERFSHLSTAGGAFLESLEGKQLPAIKVLKK